MNTNEGNDCLGESEEISQTLETCKWELQKKNILPGK